MSRPVRKYSIDSPNVYINTKFVEQLLDSLGISQSKVSLDLNWGRDTLRKYCTYRSLISKEKREELANYFHCNPSKLINYYPTADMIKTHHDLNINHNSIRSSNDQSTIINNDVSAKDYSTELLLEKISSLEKSIKLLTNEQKEFIEFFKTKFQQSDERSSKQQLYILNQLKEKN